MIFDFFLSVSSMRHLGLDFTELPLWLLLTSVKIVLLMICEKSGRSWLRLSTQKQQWLCTPERKPVLRSVAMAIMNPILWLGKTLIATYEVV